MQRGWLKSGSHAAAWMKFLIDMSLSPRLGRSAAAGGLGSSAVLEYGVPPQLLMQRLWASHATNGYAVLSHDLDFGANPSGNAWRKTSVVQIRAAM
jgi:predicted nuclease of predicted toxin-antitoxin system